MPDKRNVFISYRHNTHSKIKDELIELNKKYSLFVDYSVDSGDISDALSDEEIRREIRDRKLKGSSVTLFIHGQGTDKRKFIDWELAGSMIDYTGGKRSAIIIINTLDYSMSASNTSAIDVINDTTKMVTIPRESLMSERHWRSKLPYAPERIIKNLAKDDVNINVIKWDTIVSNPHKLMDLINKVAVDREKNKYDTSIPLKKGNY